MNDYQSLKNKKYAENKVLLEELFKVDKTLDDSLSDCKCGCRPRTRYAREKVWIECKFCGLQSATESKFSLTRNNWDYVISR